MLGLPDERYPASRLATAWDAMCSPLRRLEWGDAEMEPPSASAGSSMVVCRTSTVMGRLVSWMAAGQGGFWMVANCVPEFFDPWWLVRRTEAGSPELVVVLWSLGW